MGRKQGRNIWLGYLWREGASVTKCEALSRSLCGRGVWRWLLNYVPTPCFHHIHVSATALHSSQFCLQMERQSLKHSNPQLRNHLWLPSPCTTKISAPSETGSEGLAGKWVLEGDGSARNHERKWISLGAFEANQGQHSSHEFGQFWGLLLKYSGDR